MVQQNDIQFDVLPIKLSDVCHSNFYACFYMETTRNDGWNNNNDLCVWIHVNIGSKKNRHKRFPKRTSFARHLDCFANWTLVNLQVGLNPCNFVGPAFANLFYDHTCFLSYEKYCKQTEQCSTSHGL